MYIPGAVESINFEFLGQTHIWNHGISRGANPPWPATKPDPARYGRKPDALAASHLDAPRLDRYHTSDPPQPAEFKDGEKKETSVYVNEFKLGKFCWFITKCIET